MSLFCTATCRKQLAEKDALIERFKNHDSVAYGLPDLKDPKNALKLNTSDVQRIWHGLGVDHTRQHMLGRAWYAPRYMDVCKFVSRCVSHMTNPKTGEFDCADYSDVMLSERMALGLYGATQLEWYLAIIGRISGQYQVKQGEINHAWNWFICLEKPKDICFIDYFEPRSGGWKVAERTWVSLYTPETHGPLVNIEVEW
jgi:hypothetical protein